MNELAGSFPSIRPSGRVRFRIRFARVPECAWATMYYETGPRFSKHLLKPQTIVPSGFARWASRIGASRIEASRMVGRVKSYSRNSI